MIDKELLIQYINALKSVDGIHKTVFGKDKNLVTPVLISQGIVKYLLKLDDYLGGVEYDAIKNEETYEIKATSSDEGTTTINLKSKPDHLLWIYIDYSNGLITIKRKSGFSTIDTSEQLFNEKAIEKQKVDIYKNALKDRVTIILKNIKWDDDVLVYNLNDLSPRL